MAQGNNTAADFGADFLENVFTAFYLFALFILVFTCLVTGEIFIGLGFAGSGLALLFLTKFLIADLKRIFTKE